MIETQSSCNQWAERTFGPCDNASRLVARANEEMGELLSQITMPEIKTEKIAEECADVAMILFRVADFAEHDLMPIFQLDNLLVPTLIYGPAARANSMLSFLFERLSPANVPRWGEIGRLVGAIVIKLAEISAAVGTPLGTAIDQKMAILRTREWEIVGDGTGYHRKGEHANG